VNPRRLASGATLAGILAAALAVPRVVHGGDAVSKYETAIAVARGVVELEQAVKAGSEARIVEACDKLPELVRTANAAAGVSNLGHPTASALFGKLVKQTKLPDARKRALRALVEIGDGEQGWSALRASYPGPDSADASKFDLEIVKAVGDLHADGGIDSLLQTLRYAKRLDLAVTAAESLGSYHPSKQRERVLREVVSVAKAMRPLPAGAKTPSPKEVVDRWEGLRTALGPALDRLTGASLVDVDAWIEKVESTKGSLAGLFHD
jgi:hypothetical protein